MAGAEIIGAAIGVLLLVLVGYIMVGSTLTSAEVVASAQKDITIQNEAQLKTDITLTDVQYSTSIKILTFKMKNTGSEMIGDFKHIDIFVTPLGSAPIYHTFNAAAVPGSGVAWSTWAYTTISPDKIHPNMLDPGETMQVSIGGFTPPPLPDSISVSTSNGASNSEYVTVVA